MNTYRRTTFAAAAGLTAALLAGTAAAAAPSSFAESRGYQNCRDAAATDVHLIKVDSDYYIYAQEDTRRFYLNGYAFRNGSSEAVKIACETTVSGNRVLAVTVDGGRYAGRVVDPVNVAQN